MTIDRAIEILDPDHREAYDSIEPINEACRMAMEALRRFNVPYGGIYTGLADYEEGHCIKDGSVYAMICEKLIELGVLKYERAMMGSTAQWAIKAVKWDV